MTKSVEEIVKTKDGEAAFLLMISNDKGPDVEVPGLFENIEAIQDLAMPWMASAFEGGGIPTLAKLSSDENRKTLLHSTIAESGFASVIAMIADDRVAAHRPLLVDFFVEFADDPGCFDQLLEDHADKLTDEQKLKLLKKKGTLG